MLDVRETGALIAALVAFAAVMLTAGAMARTDAPARPSLRPAVGDDAQRLPPPARRGAAVPQAQAGRPTVVRTVDPGSLGVEVRAAAAAFNGAGARIRLSVVAPYAPAQITVRRDRRIPGPITGMTTLECPTLCRPRSADIEIDTEALPRGALLRVTAHELGHALGLGHDNKQTDGPCVLMAPVLEPECERAPLLSPADRQALIALWGVATRPPGQAASTKSCTPPGLRHPPPCAAR